MRLCPPERTSGVLVVTVCVCMLLLSGCAQIPEATVATKPLLASGQRYEKLPAAKLATVARRDAETDFNNGHLILLTAGFPGEPSKQERYLRKHYQVRYFAVAGCVVSDSLIDVMRIYNGRMTELIVEKYKKDIFAESKEKTRGWF